MSIEGLGVWFFLTHFRLGLGCFTPCVSHWFSSQSFPVNPPGVNAFTHLGCGAQSIPGLGGCFQVQVGVRSGTEYPVKPRWLVASSQVGWLFVYGGSFLGIRYQLFRECALAVSLYLVRGDHLVVVAGSSSSERTVTLRNHSHHQGPSSPRPPRSLDYVEACYYFEVQSNLPLYRVHDPVIRVSLVYR